MREGNKRHSSADLVAGTGLLDPRAWLPSGVAIAGAMSAGLGSGTTGAAPEPLKDDPWSLGPGSNVKSYLMPSRFVDGSTQRHR